MTILLYHGVAPRSDSGIYNYRGKFIAPEDFEIQMRYFVRHYSIVGLDEGIRMMREGRLPRNALAITFDDGYRNFYQYAFPILKRMNIPSTMFLATGFVFDKVPLWLDRLEYVVGKELSSRTKRVAHDTKLREMLKGVNEVEREKKLRSIEEYAGIQFEDFGGERAGYTPLSADEIREMRQAGITFGTHTKTHPILSRLPQTRVEEEVRGSKAELETVTDISEIFAYPNGQPGDWNNDVEQTVRATGFTGALTTMEGVNTVDTPPYALKRMAMDATDGGSAFAAIASGVRVFLSKIKHYAD